MKEKPPGEHINELGMEFSGKIVLMHHIIAYQAGLSGADHKYLQLIIKNEKLTAGELAEITGLTTGSVTAAIDRLEKKKLVRRLADKADRRKVYIVPDTAIIKKQLQPFFTDLGKRSSRLVASFNESELAIIERYFISSMKMMDDVIKQLKNSK